METPLAFFLAFLAIFLAEVGDKSQVALLLLAAKHDPTRVFFGAALAFGTVTLLATTAGMLLFAVLPASTIRPLAGGVFLASAAFVLGRAVLRAATEEEAETGTLHPDTGSSAFVTSFALVALSELGDKSQMGVIGLTAGMRAPIFVFMGSLAAFAFASMFALRAGTEVRDRLGATGLDIASGVSFAVVGIVILLL